MSALALPPPRRLAGLAADAVRRSPATALVLLTLLATTVLLRYAVADDDQVFRALSTNIANLTTRPLRSMVGSAFVLEGERWVPTAAQLAVSLGLLERRFGTVRALAVFASAHVLATLVTEGGVWVGLHLGDVDASARTQIDVGVSYGLWGAVGAAVLLVPRPRRVLVLGLLAGYLVVGLLLDHDMTGIGHLLSFTIGLAWWPVMARRDRVVRTGQRPRGGSAIVANQEL